MSDHDRADGEGALVERLEVIEEQPLAARADAYAQLHAELSDRLEGADAPRHG
ncbi:hypothetical protein [Leifsonia aquatica]|uniref:hypothetical protein n=1 Tax=Leifsonia aquatica TaxID=144185 RepID=UPI000B2A9E42|nr:hypothetical protein [Leifsonia aquatica]